jgi:MoaA/NifB/PqqE/SkfB family radical SAM enzyme
MGADTVNYQHLMFDTPENDKRQYVEYEQAFGETQIPEGFCESRMDNDDIRELTAAIKEIKRMSDGFPVTVSPGLRDDLIQEYYLNLSYHFPNVCLAPWKLSTVLPDGTVTACFGYKIGNIHEEPFGSLWNNERMLRFRKRIRRGLLPTCLRCCGRKY